MGMELMRRLWGVLRAHHNYNNSHNHYGPTGFYFSRETFYFFTFPSFFFFLFFYSKRKSEKEGNWRGIIEAVSGIMIMGIVMVVIIIPLLTIFQAAAHNE